ncbi:MAG: aldo/keto reductase [candidate division KSB1 bacterium]|nr:aldo/keto reductase [candidate division KSB1 bacterium]
MNRQEFLKRLLAGLAAGLFEPVVRSAETLMAEEEPVPQRTLGRTGVRVPILALGGYHIGRIRDEAEAMRMIHFALDQGLFFFDTAESYQRGGSEERLGRALKDRRQRAFLMTKTYEPANRDAAGARAHLEGSLRRLQTDYLDLWQLHSVQTPEDVDRAFREGGAMESIMKAKQEGKVRFIGVTGHRNPDANLRAIHYWDQGWKFDTMQMPINAVDYHQESFQRQVLPELVKRGIGVIAMKTSADGRLLREGLLTIGECLHYVWSLPVSVAVVGMTNMQELKDNLQHARTFRPLREDSRKRMLGRLKPHARLELEWYKRPRR